MKNLFKLKTARLFLPLIIAFFSAKTSYATHGLGSDIVAQCIGPNQYKLILTVYRDCNGTSLNNNQDIDYFSACAGLSGSIPATKLSVTNITQVCPTGQSSCNGGTGTFGVEKHIFEATINLPASVTCDVRFSWSLCCRNLALTNIANPNSENVYTETIIDNSVAPCNNSPEFTLDPVLYFPVNQQASLNYLVDDVDGDSLYYSLVNALDANGIPVIYTSGYSGTAPLGAGVPITIDQNSGTISFLPTAAEVAAFAIKIEEFRNGVSIGSITRDMNVSILPITTSVPQISGFGNGSSIDTVISPGQLFTADIYLTGSSSSGIVGTVSNNIPGLFSSQQIINTDTTILSLSWYPPTSSTGSNILYITAKSDACPVKLTASKGFNLMVDNNPPVVSASVLNNATCATSNDGAAYHITSGLQPGYTVEWYDNTTTLIGTSDTLLNVGVGWYTVRVSNGPGSSTVTDNVYIHHISSTTATAAFTKQYGCVLPAAATFTDQSTINDTSCGNSWYWDFGNGATSTDQNPTHVYTAPGVYPVSLTVTDCSINCPTTVWDTIKNSNLTVDFIASPLTGCAPFSSNFSDASISDEGAASWNWDFGDGNTDTVQNPTNIYASPGSYTVSLTVTDSSGCTIGPETKINYISTTLTLNSTDTRTECDSLVWIDGVTYTTNNNTATHTLTSVSGCDSIVTLDLTISNSSSSTIDTQVACDTYTWINGNTYNLNTNNATHTLTNSIGCDSVVTLNLTINHSSSSTDTQVTCSAYTWIDGNTYTASNTTAIHTLTNAAGCDSIVTLNLTINSSASTTDTQTACDTYTWIDGNTYTTSNNTATHTLSNAVGCDSVVVLDLTINNSSASTDTQVACNAYTWIDGNAYTSSNTTATHTLTNAVGCDSVITLNLNLNNNITTTDTHVACNSYTWIDGNTYNSSNNTATHILTAASGCDSIITLDLTINTAIASTDTQVACGTYTWINGNTYNMSNNTATHTLNSSAGCDSVVTLNLTINNNSSASTDTQTACDTYTWIDGNTYTASNNTAMHTLNNSVGCDSVVSLDLTINNSSNTSTDTQLACNSFTWIDGNTYTASNNTATHTFTNVAGCDSVIFLDLTIAPNVNTIDTNVVCDSLIWIDGNTYTTNNTTATHILTAAAGCDSIVHLDLTVTSTIFTTDTRTACDSFTWIDGVTYTTNNTTAKDTLTAVGGCDSIISLNLTIINSTSSTDLITTCDSLAWIDGNTYYVNNTTATHTLTNAVGCDSVITLDLTMNYSNSATDIQVACDSYTWIDGITYTVSSNTNTYTLTNAAGCDSVITLDLTINNSNTGIDTQIACDTYTWIDGNTYNLNNNTATHTLTNAAGCDSVVTLNLTIKKSSSSIDTITACDAYTWIDGITYTTSNNTNTHTLTNAVGCDSVITLNLTINNSNTGIDTQTACDIYTWIDGNTYNLNNTNATHTLSNVYDCDSVVTLNLTINNSKTGIDTQTACDTYTWLDGNTYTSNNNTATHTLTTTAGCDSVVTLNLTINNSNSGIDTRVTCNTFTWINGITYTSSNNTATHTITNSKGCDSLVTLDLTIMPTLSTTDTRTACNTFTWIDGVTYTSNNNTATKTLTAAAGCDSIVTLDLTILPYAIGTDLQIACDNFVWTNGITYTTSNNTAKDTIITAGACDSIVSLDLTISNSSSSTDTYLTCDSLLWIDGITYYTNNNTATHTLTNATGCDSVVSLDLTIINSSASIDTQTACNSYTWSNGITYTVSNNTATQTFTNAAGCDSVITLNLTIGNSITSVDYKIACNTYTWINGNTYNTSNNTATHHLTTTSGCDSIVTLDLTINNTVTSTDVQTACDSLTWIDGITYYANNNTATHNLTTELGCDSVVTLNLTINNSNLTIDTQTTCDSYTWIDGNTYTTSNNTASQTYTNAAGCDSVVRLDLTINYNNTATDIQTACDSYTWIDGNTYTASNNTATHTLTNATGCDSVVTLNLSINNSSTGTDAHLTCVSFTWIDGNTYTASNNTATHTLINAVGCDSIVALNLTIVTSLSSTDTQTACDSYTWINGVTYTSNNNTAKDTLTAAAGCDSIITLNLTINNSSTVTDVQVACDSYSWINGVTYTTSNNTVTHTLTNAAGCDSVITLDLTINKSSTGTDTKSACDSFLWLDGVTYTTSNNTAMFTTTNTVGCDSVITLDLTIGSLDTTVTISKDTLTANQAGATYQWIDCNNGNAIIPGATNQSYIPPAKGNYAVIITSSNCVDTSSCIYLDPVSVETINPLNAIKIYPNPTTGNAFVNMSGVERANLSITDLTGKILYRLNTINSNRIELPMTGFAKGVYLINITTNQQSKVFKLIKE